MTVVEECLNAILFTGLTALRNQLTVRFDEKIEAADGRLVLVQTWQIKSPGCHDLFEVWDKYPQVIPDAFTRFQTVLIISERWSIDTSACIVCVPAQSFGFTLYLPWSGHDHIKNAPRVKLPPSLERLRDGLPE